MFREVPVLPAVVPVAAATLIGLLWSLRRRDRLSVARACVAVAVCVYVAGVVANTVFPIFLDKPASSAPFRVYVVPLAGYELGDATMNVLVFIPVGILVPLLTGQASWWRVGATGAAFSLAIELAQLVTGHFLGGGHVADVNDLVFNVVGSVLGYGLFAALLRVRGVAGLVDRFRWR